MNSSIAGIEINPYRVKSSINTFENNNCNFMHSDLKYREREKDVEGTTEH
jgi:hypothetical protein